jgi:hypothetical protein
VLQAPRTVFAAQGRRAPESSLALDADTRHVAIAKQLRPLAQLRGDEFEKWSAIGGRKRPGGTVDGVELLIS